MYRPTEDYVVIVPSFQRPHLLNERTLPALLRGGVDPARIAVYLHDHDPHLADYMDVVAAHGVRHRITSARGITEQRTVILHDHPPGTPMVSVDDDVTEWRRAVTRKALEPVDDVDALFRQMFDETRQRGLYVWGLAPVMNPYFMKPGQLTEGLRFLIFTCWGAFTRPGHPVHQFTVPTKDDYEFSLRAWWWDGAVLRNDGVVAKADIMKLPGGCMAAGRDPQQTADAVAVLQSQWPGLIRINNNRRSRFVEIVLSAKRRHAGNSPDAPPPGMIATPQVGG